mmetsp:Transcript_22600/g.33880  ORF Transcript_22600/g.33880 Transcript_22600/m.33880 type:complete len:106 (-) Transcript_22600:64-381(-)
MVHGWLPCQVRSSTAERVAMARCLQIKLILAFAFPSASRKVWDQAGIGTDHQQRRASRSGRRPIHSWAKNGGNWREAKCHAFFVREAKLDNREKGRDQGICTTLK